MSRHTPTLTELHQQLQTELRAITPWLHEPADGFPPLVFGGGDPEQWLVRLTAMVLALIAKHPTDRRGDCRRCQPVVTGWRRRLPRWPRRHPCIVWKAARTFLTGPDAVARWHALGLSGHTINLADLYADEPHPGA